LRQPAENVFDYKMVIFGETKLLCASSFNLPGIFCARLPNAFLIKKWLFWKKNFCAAAILICPATFAPACRIRFQLKNGCPGKKLLCCSVFDLVCCFCGSLPNTFSITTWLSWKKTFVLQRF